MDINIAYQDNHLLVVYKPTNVPQDSLTNDIREYIKKSKNKEGNIYLKALYELDQCMSGVIVFCLTQKAYDRCNAALEHDETDFRFLAITVGELDNLNGGHSVTCELLTNGKYRRVPELNKSALRVDFNYRKLSEVKPLTLMLVEVNRFLPNTLRFGLFDMGLPIFGDSVYGGDSLAKNTFVAFLLLDVGIMHPVTKERMTFRCMPPSEHKPWSYFDLDKLLKYRQTHS